MRGQYRQGSASLLADNSDRRQNSEVGKGAGGAPGAWVIDMGFEGGVWLGGCRRDRVGEVAVVEEASEFNEFFPVFRFHEVILRAEFFGSFDVSGFTGAGDDDDGCGLQFGPGLNPGEDFEPVEQRHFEVDQNEVGQGVLLAIGVEADAANIIDGLLAVADVYEAVG